VIFNNILIIIIIIVVITKNHVISKWIHYDTITQRQLNVLIIEKPEDGTNAETCSLMFNKKFINIKKRCVD
jgi:hypothetical protein